MDVIGLFTEKNVGGYDRIARLLMGAVCLAIVLLFPLPLLAQVALALLGLIGLVTGALSHCTLYSLFGWSTLEKKKWKGR